MKCFVVAFVLALPLFAHKTKRPTMKSIALVLLVALAGSLTLVLGVGAAFAQDGGVLAVYADTGGITCDIVDSGGMLTLHVVHTLFSGSQFMAFSAPVPPCMTGATWLSDTTVHATFGDSQTGLSLVYPCNTSSPHHVLTINIATTGSSQPCCEYPVLTSSGSSGPIIVDDCQAVDHFATGGVTIVNSNPSCACVIPVDESTWGGIKAIFSE